MIATTNEEALPKYRAEETQQLNISLLQVLLPALKERPFLDSTFDSIVDAFVSQSLPFVQLLVQQGLLDASILVPYVVRSHRCTASATEEDEASDAALPSILTWLVHNGGGAINEPLDGVAALHQACAAETTTISQASRARALVQHLLQLGADPTVRDFAGHTALHVACRRGCRTRVELLLSRMDNPERYALLRAQGHENRDTALHLACVHGHADVAELLLQLDSDLWNVRDNDDRTAFHIACAFGHVDVARRILALTIQQDTSAASLVNARTEDGWSPLHCASRHGHADAVRWLLTETEAQVDAVGRSRLFSYECIEEQLIVDEMDAIHVKNMLYGETPLHLACQFGHVEVIRLLVQVGKADTQIKNDMGKKPLDVMARRRKVHQLLQGKSIHAKGGEDESSTVTNSASIALMLRGC